MAQPVWVLSVDLQTKTATFQSGMAEAAKSARGAFTEISSGSGAMSREVSGSMMNARHGVMLLGDEFGIHLPRALTTFLAEIGPVGAAMEAAFPFLAIAVGATMLIEALVKVHEAGEKLTTDQVKFGTAVQNTFNTLDQKILQAEIRSDELRNDHLGALHKQLELIDKQSMAELVHAFDEVAKSADVVFADLKSHWYTFGIGSVGAKHALDEFQTKYDSLLAQGKDSEAADLLKGTRESAQKVLEAMQQANAAKPKMGTGSDEAWAANLQYGQAMQVIKKAGLENTKDELAAQQALLDTLNAQMGVESRITQLKAVEGSNVKREAGGAIAADQSAAAREAAESQLRIGEQSLAADRAASSARLQVQRASIAEMLANDIAFADKDFALKMTANEKETAALDKYAKDYPNQLKAMHDKALELEQEHATQVADLKTKAALEQNAKDLADLEQSEREKIDATQQGSAARLAAIDAAIKEEQSRNMQELSSYRQLLTQRVETVRQMAQEEAQLKEAAAKEAADNDEKMASLAFAAAKEHQALMDSTHRVSIQQQVAQEIAAANQEYALKLAAMNRELQALDKSGKDYQNKLKEIQDKEKQLVQQHENEITAIKDKAEEERNSRILSAEKRFNDTIAAGMTQVLMGHKSFASQMTALGNQVVTGMMENAIKSIMADDMTKERDAAAAARKAYLSGVSIGGAAGPILGAVMGAAAFTAVMAFEGGGVVPGVSGIDNVPAMLTPGEGVVPKGVMEGLQNMVRNGGMDGGSNNYQVHAPVHLHVSALDSAGMDKVLEKHAPILQKHFENSLRKMNR